MSLVGNSITVVNELGERIRPNIRSYRHQAQPGIGPDFRGAVEWSQENKGWGFWNAEAGGMRLVVELDGYRSQEVIATAPADIHVTMKRSAPALHLEVLGRDFVDVHGHPTCLSCVDQFQALRLMIDGEMGRLDDLAGEALGFGFNWWRVMLMGDISKNTLFSLYPSEARYRDCLYELPRWANRNGIGILGEAHADNQVVKANQSEQWRLVTDAFRGTTSIASGGNEHGSGNDHGKNGFDPQALENPGSEIVWSRGSAVADEVTPQHGATCSSFHQRTDYPKTLYDATASVLFMEEQGYTVCMMDEPTRFNIDGSTKTEHLPNDVPPTRFAWQLAKVYSAMWDLACFHNQAGQRGILMPPPLRAVAAEWARGMRL